MKKQLSFLIFLFLSACSSKDLGGGIYILEGDRVQDKIIVYCLGKKFGDCISGSYLIPRSYNEHFDSSGHYKEYVDNVAYNNDYIIATTFFIQERKHRYWIVVKNAERDKSILGPLDYKTFLFEKEARQMTLDF